MSRQGELRSQSNSNQHLALRPSRRVVCFRPVCCPRLSRKVPDALFQAVLLLSLFAAARLPVRGPPSISTPRLRRAAATPAPPRPRALPAILTFDLIARFVIPLRAQPRAQGTTKTMAEVIQSHRSPSGSASGGRSSSSIHRSDTDAGPKPASSPSTSSSNSNGNGNCASMTHSSSMEGMADHQSE